MESKKYVDFDKVITTYKTFGHLNLHNALEAFNEIPAADVRPVVRGEWIAEQFVDDGGLLHEILSKHDTLVCSICGYKYLDLFDSPRHNFCPNCGADMREAINE